MSKASCLCSTRNQKSRQPTFDAEKALRPKCSRVLVNPSSGSVAHLDRPPAFEAGTPPSSNARAPAQLLENSSSLLKPRPWHIECSRGLKRTRTNALVLSWPLLFLGLIACGGAQPDAIRVASTCVSSSGVNVVVEAGTTAPCDLLASAVDAFRSIYEERWGPMDLVGWAVRIRTTAQRDGDSGLTMHSARTVDVALEGLAYLPHEFHHVRLGPSSDGHEAWCQAYWPLERAEVGLDEGAYLGCGR